MVRLFAMGVWVPRVLVFVLRVEERFALQSLPEWLRSITPKGPPRRPRLTAPEMARVIWNVLRWDRGRFNNGCFMRSFTRYRFFREMGYPVVFQLGVEETEDGAAGLRSHAWLTLDGRPFLEPEPDRISRYRILYAYPEPDAGSVP